MKRLNAVMFLILCTLFISGCTNTISTGTSVNIPNENDYTALYIQGVDENGAASSATYKTVTNAGEIKAFVDKVNNVTVTEPPKEEISQKAEELDNPGNYIFALSKSEKLDDQAYYMYFFEDGSIQFQQKDKNEMIYLSKEKHPELLGELKESFDINF